LIDKTSSIHLYVKLKAPASPAYGVCISWLVRCARASSNYSDFWNVVFIRETGCWTRDIEGFALFDLLESLYSGTEILSKYVPSLQRQTSPFHYGSKSLAVTITVFITILEQNSCHNSTKPSEANVKNTLTSHIDKKISSETLSRNEKGRFGALKSDSTHHFFRNTCTKLGSLQCSQFSGCWLILSYEFWLSLCKIARSSVILLLPLYTL
jgi:hypothetical protein